MTRRSGPGTRGEQAGRRALALGLSALLAAGIGWLTLTPSDQQHALSFALPDKVYHAVAFAALILPAALMAVSSLPWLVAAAVVYGGAIELIQPHVGRSAELGDMAANVAGLAAGLALGWGLRRRPHG